MARKKRSGRLLVWPAILLGGAAIATVMLGSVRAGAAPVPPTHLGINLPGLGFWVETRSFTNIALYSGMRITDASRQKDFIDAPGMINAYGWPANLTGDLRAYLPMLVPQGAKKGDVFHCSWQGQATATVIDAATVIKADANNVYFALRGDGRDTLRGVGENRAQIRLMIMQTSPADPLRDVDCREADRPRSQIYNPAFIRSLAPYHVVRFMDWMNANGGPVADFARETMPQRPVGPGNAVTLTNMIALANEAKIDPWFTMPYDASSDYVRRFAQMAHDRLAPDRTVYVELGNEMWNDHFAAARQAKDDGVAAKLSTNPYEAQLRQYGLRSKQMLDIWTQVYADRPKHLVRIISAQQANTYSTNTILGFRDVAKSVDAIAIAPYFGGDVYPRLNAGPRPATLDEAFSKLKTSLNATLAAARDQKAIADRMGKRLIAYEGGQHIVIPDDIDLLYRVNSDPRMGQIYTTFLEGWARDLGDTLVLYHQVGPIGNFGAWGLEEYDNEPLDKAPKKKAVLEFVARHKQP